jgi:anti-anti-sigma factor
MIAKRKPWQNQWVFELARLASVPNSQMTKNAVRCDENDRHGRATRNGSQEMLRIDIETTKTFATLICAGQLILGVETETLRTMVQSRTEENIRVDLSGVEKIDASGLGLLVELQSWARETGHILALIDPSEAVWRLVILTKLYSTLEISYSDAAATAGEHGGIGYDEMIA